LVSPFKERKVKRVKQNKALGGIQTTSEDTVCVGKTFGERGIRKRVSKKNEGTCRKTKSDISQRENSLGLHEEGVRNQKDGAQGSAGNFWRQ